VTGARVANLIPLYACTVFTGFTMAGAGMTKYQLTHEHEHRRRDLAIAAATFIASALVTLIFVVTEFTRGAWLIVVCIPLIVWALMRTSRRYAHEKRVLAEDTDAATNDAPLLRRHIVLVLVDTVDLATARAVQLARSLSTSAEIRAVHFVIDAARAREMARQWGQLGRWRLPLELVECPDRRIPRAATEMVAELADDGETEVTLVLPRRLYKGLANRLFHSNTADRIVAAVSTVPNVSATIAPFDVGGILRADRGVKPERASEDEGPVTSQHVEKRALAPASRNGTTRIADVVYRRRSRVEGRVHSIRVQPWSGIQVLECTLVDRTGAINVVFLGRNGIPGIDVGVYLTAEGMVGKHGGRLAIMNPLYEIRLSKSEGRPAVS
jgi:hypothetical protein